MAKKVNINGKLISRPGVYTQVKSGIRNTPPNLPAGHILIIDDGIGAGWGGGQGGLVYTFDKIKDYQDFVKGGELWNIGQPMFKPLLNVNGTVINGASKVSLIQARATTPATIPFNITAGVCSFVTKDQGVNANGVEDSGDILRQGYAGTIERVNALSAATFVTTTTTPASSGVAQVNTVVATNVNAGVTYSITQATITKSYTALAGDTPTTVYTALVALINADATLSPIVTATIGAGLVITADAVNTAFVQTSAVIQAAEQFVFKFWHGSFKGTDSLNNTPYEGITAPNADPILLATSPAVTTLDELAAWAATDADIQAGFIPNIATGDITLTDLANNAGNILATGGTETYSSAAWTAALNTAKTVDNNLFLSDKYGANATHAHNDDIVDIINGSKYERFLYVGGGATNADYATISKVAAVHFNSDKVIVVHGDGKKTIRNGYKRVSSFWVAANTAGRTAGLDVQTPITYKQIGIDAVWDKQLDEDQQEDALDSGVLAHFFDDELGYVVVLKGVNTLQNNDNLVNEDGSSPSSTVKRITAQLNKEAAIFLKKKFFGNANVGPNRNTVTEQDIKAALEGFLQSRTASTITDNYILRFGNITVTIDQDIYNISYEFVPNFEVSILVVTGIILES